jgi:acyl-coenzyme A synthetase/AMP-(fatty) acid ligase
MTPDYVAYHAAERPESVALVNDGRTVTYAELDRDTQKFAAAIHELGVVPGQFVAIGCDDLHVNVLLLLACERLGLAAASLASREGPSAPGLLARMDLVISERPFPGAAVRGSQTITPAWVESVLARDAVDPLPPAPRDPEDIVRIGRTSGTTGSARQLAFNRRQRDARVEGQVWGARLTRHSRCLVTLPFGVNSSYVLALGALRSGAALILDNKIDVAELIARHGITHMMLLPLHLRTILDGLPAGFEKPADLTIITIGAPLSEPLRAEAMARLASRICDLYGAQEAGNIAWRTSAGTGGIATLWPDVRAEVVDDADRPLPIGETGRLRVRTRYMVQGYLGDPEATRRMFRNGWFYPGDLAVLPTPARLQLVGRGDELLNLGGTKIPPAGLEELVQRTLEAKDAGVCTVRNSDGIDQLFIAVVECAVADQEMLSRLREVLQPMQIGRFCVMRLPQLPRNAAGKLRRDELKSLMTEALARTSQAPNR